MKSLIALVVVSLVAGVGLGAALGYYDARPWAFRLDAPPPSPVAADNHAPAAGEPRLQIKETVYNFDKMERGAARRHEFPLQNTGKAPLTVSFVSHTCKCTKVELDGEDVHEGTTITIAPGETGIASLEWEAKVPAGQFRHGATFSTNDRSQSRLELVVEGDIVESSTLQPPLLNFGPVHVGQTGAAETMVIAFTEPEVKINSAEVAEPELAKQVEVTIEPVAKEQLPDPKASAAARVKLVFHTSGVLGPFSGTLRLTTNLKQAERLAVPIYGSVRGDVSMFSPYWNDAQGLLKMPPIASAEGGEVKLDVAIRGDAAEHATLTVDRVEPKELQATLGDARKLGAQIRQPLLVTVPKGTRPMVRFGEDQGGEGLIVLKTGHPDTPEVRLRVQFAVQP